MLIFIIGNKRSGKDTIANYIVSNYKFSKYAFANPIKKICYELFKWDDNTLNNNDKDLIENETGIVPRHFFEWFGTNIMQHQFTSTFSNSNIQPRSIWAYSIFKDIEHKLQFNPNENIIITDLRFIHELELFINKFGYDMINFIVITRNDYSITSPFHNWDYEINDILNVPFVKSKLSSYNYIKNISNIDTLYNNIDKYFMECFNMEKHRIDFNNINFC